MVTGMMAIVGLAIVGLVRNSYQSWKLGSCRSSLLQDGRAAIEQMVRILRQAKGFVSVSPTSSQAGDITITSVYDVTEEFRLNTGTSELEYGQPGSLSALAGPVTSLVFTYYDIDGLVLADPVLVGSIQSVHIEATFADSENSFTLSNRVFLPTELPVVINEIMYNPPGAPDQALEWVELYNLSDSDVNVDGWTIWTGTPDTADSLSAHPQFGDGSTTIPAGGYAIITAETTTFFEELTVGGDFESKPGFENNWTRDNWDRTKWNAHTGNYKGESSVSGGASLYTDISVPSGFDSYLFFFWEMTTVSVDQTQVTATIRDSNDLVLATAYSGQMHSDWTYHTMDIAAYSGQSIRIHFSTNKTTSEGVLLLDDIFAVSSYVDLDAIRLSTGDNQIGNGLGDNNDTVAVASGSVTIDSVTYDDSWGGDGDGTSLARIDPEEASNDGDNWTSGPVNGTPGSEN